MYCLDLPLLKPAHSYHNRYICLWCAVEAKSVILHGRKLMFIVAMVNWEKNIYCTHADVMDLFFASTLCI